MSPVKNLYCVFVLCVSLIVRLSISQTYNVDDSGGFGRRFDGIGAISGGGATSKLLVNYPEQQRTEILDFLFKPNHGASLHILKVEIGGDDQSSDGSEASHMHESWDENYQRGYEWWLMTEAKKRNPDILLCGLPWTFPAWIGNGTLSAYAIPEVTVDYVLRWINGAKTHYNLTIDFIGIWNEKDFSPTYIKLLRKTLDERGLTHVKICAPDDKGWKFAEAVLADPELAAAVDFIGSHYPSTRSTADAIKTGKQLWASEDSGGCNSVMDGACRAATLNQNYVNGMMTASLTWNLIASYYQGLPYFLAGMMTAVEPWSGHYQVDSPIWANAHTTQFTKPGWQYLLHGAGVGNLTSGGTYVTLTDRTSGALTIVIETVVCSHEANFQTRRGSRFADPTSFQRVVVPQTATFKLMGSYARLRTLNVWYSKFSSGGSFFVEMSPIQVNNGTVTLSLGVDEVYTLTTVSMGHKGTAPDPPTSQPFPLPYKDEFDEYVPPAEPYNLAQQVGVWEVAEVGPPHGNVIRQMVTHHPLYWCWFWGPRLFNNTLNVIGDFNWTDIYIEVEARVGSVNGSKGVHVAARINNGGCRSILARGVFFFVFPGTHQFILSKDLGGLEVLLRGTVQLETEWMTLGLLLKADKAYGYLNGVLLFTTPLPSSTPANGFVGLGTYSYGIADFDNLRILTAQDGWNHVNQTETLFFDP